MEKIINNLSAIFPFFAISWVLFLFSAIRKPQKLRNSYLLLLVLGFTALLLTGLFGDNMGQAMLAVFLMFCLALFLVPTLLIINGIRLLKKEGRSLPHMLSLLLGIVVAVGEIAAVAAVLSTADFLVPMELGFFLSFIFAGVFYFSFTILAFVVYVLFMQWMPHRMNFDYVIIHGAGLVEGKKVGRLLGNRIDKAIEIYNKCGEKPLLIPSGGQGPDEELAEAQAMKQYLLDKGIPEEHIIVEDRSATTMENLIYSKEIIEKNGGARRVALVSSNYHVYRCTVYASKLHLKCTGIGAKVAFYYWPSAVIREFAAIHSQKKHLILLLAGYVIIVVLPSISILFN